jgi:hypothetical protein
LIRVYLENLGPFEEADLEIKPLTIFLGKNSVGKSMLSYLLWTLLSAEPKFEEVETGWEESFLVIAERVVKDVESGRILREDFERLVKAFYEDVFIEAVRIGLEERFRYTFGVEPRELVKVGRDRATIRVYGKCAKIILSIKDKLYVEELDLCIEDLLKNMKVEVLKTGYLHVGYRDERYRDEIFLESRVTSVFDVITFIISLLKYHIIMEFNAFIFGAPLTTSIMLPDSRAGITRTLLKPYISPSLLRGVLGVDQEYVGSYYMLTEWLSRNPRVLEYAKPLLEELGVSVDVRFESGAYNIHVKTWTGKSLPIAMAPSGVREVISIVIALLMISEKVRLKPEYVFIEEPEAHLHPKAQRSSCENYCEVCKHWEEGSYNYS